MTNIDILNEIKSKDCKNDKKTKMTRKLIMKRSQKMIFWMLNLLK
jgi:hypothetical protein